jgi:hypothetical protein
MKHTPLLFLILVMMVVGVVSALPTTGAVTNISAGVVTFNGAGGVSPCWFSFGYGTNMYWTTPNQSVSGSFSDTQTGSPMLSGMDYNVRACDSTGCGNVVAFTVPKAGQINATDFGSTTMIIMRSGFNPFTAASLVITPYAGAFQGSASSLLTPFGASIVWGLFFSFVFVGYWLQGRGILLPAILAIMSGTALTTSVIAVDPMFMAAGYPLLAIGLAGVFVSWISNK